LLTAAHVETDPKTRGFFSERRQIGEGTSQAAKSSMQKGGNKPLEVTSKAEPAARGVCKIIKNFTIKSYIISYSKRPIGTLNIIPFYTHI